MSTYVALLRGINVGGKNKVPMDALRAVFLSLGYTNVVTYINSGNVLFDGDAVDLPGIERALSESFGFRIPIIILEKPVILAICKRIPSSFKNDKEQKTDVFFLFDEYNKKSTLQKITTNPDVDTLLYVSGAIIWNVLRKNKAKSGMEKFIGTEIYKNMTARNVNTVRRLGELLRV